MNKRRGSSPNVKCQKKNKKFLSFNVGVCVCGILGPKKKNERNKQTYLIQLSSPASLIYASSPLRYTLPAYIHLIIHHHQEKQKKRKISFVRMNSK